MRTPNEIGAQAERRINRLLGARGVPQSGGGKFWKLDGRGGTWVISAKATTKDFIRITSDMFREAARGARGTVGAGDGVRWVLVTETDGYLIASLPLDDLIELMTGEIEPHIEPDKARNRRMRARD